MKLGATLAAVWRGLFSASCALAAQYKGTKPAVLEERPDLMPGMIRRLVRYGVVFVPSFRKTEISEVDLDAVTAYLTHRNKTRFGLLWGPERPAW